MPYQNYEHKMNAMLLKTIAAATFAVIAGPATASAMAADDKMRQVDALFSEWDSTVTPGCSFAATQDNKLLYGRGYGMANLEYDEPNDARTIFHIASLSKHTGDGGIVRSRLEQCTVRTRFAGRDRRVQIRLEGVSSHALRAIAGA